VAEEFCSKREAVCTKKRGSGGGRSDRTLLLEKVVWRKKLSKRGVLAEEVQLKR
jgi:hypothetical protein